MNTQHTMLGTMLKYQEALNDVFDPLWRTNRNAYLRAASVETGELQDLYGYKWWKKPKNDQVQMWLEVVDVMHFLLSEVARIANEPEAARKLLLEEWDKEEREILFDGTLYNLDELDFLSKCDLMKGLACAKRTSFSLYREIMEGIGLSFGQLYRMYAGKNVLNLFRQKHGDKQGTYIKIWSGREDNEYLADLMENWDEKDGMDYLYEQLEDMYSTFALGK